jgi:hypothetical protein
MMPELRRFLHAQKVQAPIEIYTDWLMVGHVDEIVSFVPARNEKGFQVLLASPRKAQGVLDRLIADGHGDVLMFEGLHRGDPTTGAPAEVGVQELRSNLPFWEANDTFQTVMDLNREMLLMELDIDEADVIELSVLFWPPAPDEPRTAAFFPDLINHLVIGTSVWCRARTAPASTARMPSSGRSEMPCPTVTRILSTTGTPITNGAGRFTAVRTYAAARQPTCIGGSTAQRAPSTSDAQSSAPRSLPAEIAPTCSRCSSPQLLPPTRSSPMFIRERVVD